MTLYENIICQQYRTSVHVTFIPACRMRFICMQEEKNLFKFTMTNNRKTQNKLNTYRSDDFYT